MKRENMMAPVALISVLPYTFELVGVVVQPIGMAEYFLRFLC